MGALAMSPFGRQKRKNEDWMHQLDGLEEGLPVGDLVRDSREDLLERQRLFVQLLERLLCAAGLVLCICKGRKEKVQWISGVTTRNSFWSLAAPRRAVLPRPRGRGWSGQLRYRLGPATKVNNARARTSDITRFGKSSISLLCWPRE